MVNGGNICYDYISLVAHVVIYGAKVIFLGAFFHNYRYIFEALVISVILRGDNMLTGEQTLIKKIIDVFNEERIKAGDSLIQPRIIVVNNEYDGNDYYYFEWDFSENMPVALIEEDIESIMEDRWPDAELDGIEEYFAFISAPIEDDEKEEYFTCPRQFLDRFFDFKYWSLIDNELYKSRELDYKDYDNLNTVFTNLNDSYRDMYKKVYGTTLSCNNIETYDDLLLFISCCEKQKDILGKGASLNNVYIVDNRNYYFSKYDVPGLNPDHTANGINIYHISAPSDKRKLTSQFNGDFSSIFACESLESARDTIINFYIYTSELPVKTIDYEEKLLYEYAIQEFKASVLKEFISKKYHLKGDSNG